MAPPATIRREDVRDHEAVRLVNLRAFARAAEAELVEALRGVSGSISLVATVETRLVGHILFTPVRIEGVAPATSGMGLGPMAVLPECQRQGIGSQLVRVGLAECRSRGEGFVVVVGHPEYYPRFGFEAAWKWRLEGEYPVSREAFMALELQAGALAAARGIVRYRPEFASV